MTYLTIVVFCSRNKDNEGLEGELYAINPDIFEKTYEVIEDVW